jgi:transcriptional regulator with XRE-family HTH domain
MKETEHKNRANQSPITLGDYIRRGREKLNLSARQLSIALNMHQSYISRVEAGTFRQPSPEKLQRIAEKLQLDFSTLYALADYEARGLPNFPAYLRVKYDISDDDLRRVVDHFEQLSSKHHIVERPSKLTTKSAHADSNDPDPGFRMDGEHIIET